MTMDLGTVLKEARVDAGLSLREVEKRTGIRNAHLSQIENGVIVKPELAMLWDLAVLYKLDYAQLLSAMSGEEQAETSGRQRQRMTVALRAMGELSPREQEQALTYMAELKKASGDG